VPKAGTKNVCSAVLNGAGVGSCTLTASQLRGGTYVITVSYTGTGGFTSSKSPPANLSVNS